MVSEEKEGGEKKKIQKRGKRVPLGAFLSVA